MSFPNRYYLLFVRSFESEWKNWHMKISMVKIKVGMEMTLSPVEIIFMKKRAFAFSSPPTKRMKKEKITRRQKYNEIYPF